MLSIIIRTFFIFFLLIIIMRFTGKRQIGELQLSELITTFLISEIAASPITNLEIPLVYAILPIALLVALEVSLSFLITKSRPMKKMLQGAPSFLIRAGKLDQKELSRQRISLEELISNLRQKDIPSIDCVNYAILEQNGQLSVFPYQTQNSPVFSHAVIIDGHIKTQVLSLSGHNEKWLTSRLKHHRMAVSDVFLFTVDDNGKEYLIRKESV